MNAPERMKMAPPSGFFGWRQVMCSEDNGVDYTRSDIAYEWKRHCEMLLRRLRKHEVDSEMSECQPPKTS